MPASYLTRPGGPEDLEFMWEMLYEAAHHSPLSDPLIARYLEGWGQPGDAAVVALDPAGNLRVGAVWYRLMSPENPGFGFVDASTPEVAIAVVPDHRAMGVGEALLRSLMSTAVSQGFDALSLSVRRDNLAAVRLYERSGFVKLFPVEGSWTMKVDFYGRDEESRRTEVPIIDKHD